VTSRDNALAVRDEDRVFLQKDKKESKEQKPDRNSSK
jgi:hypothetical protein